MPGSGAASDGTGMIRRLVLPLALAASLAAVPAAADEASDVALYTVLRAMDARVATIGYRLASADLRLCSERAPLTGLVLSDMALYPAARRAGVARAYSVDPQAAAPIFVAAVAAGSPAWDAGLRPGHGVVAIDGAILADAGPAIDGSTARMAAIDARLPAWLADGSAELTLAPAAGAAPVRLATRPGCASAFQVKASSDLNAAADGRLVQINAAFVAFARDDEELAALLAHEFAHNILRHRARLDAAGVDRGGLRDFGRNARLIRATEIEADRLSVWLLAAAGYDPEAAVRVWTHWRRAKGPQIIASGTHGRTSTRIEAIAAEIVAMRAARAGDPDALPDLLALAPLD